MEKITSLSSIYSLFSLENGTSDRLRSNSLPTVTVRPSSNQWDINGNNHATSVPLNKKTLVVWFFFLPIGWKRWHVEHSWKPITVNFSIFDCAESSLLHKLFSSCEEQVLLSSYVAQTFSCCRGQALGCSAFNNWSTWGQELWLLGLSTGSTVVVHGLSYSAACEIFPDQGSNPCLLHWQMDSVPLSYQESPKCIKYLFIFL